MIPLMKNAFINEYETKQALAEFILKAPRLSMDSKCFEFEAAFAKRQGRKHAILCNSGGSANLALLQALKNLSRLKDEEAVGFSALTWSTNIMPILQMGLQVIPVDCDQSTLNVSSSTLEQRLSTTKLKALFITNVLGFAGDLDKISDICRDKGILLIEDNCEALGTEIHGVKTGNFGLAATFSFFVAHHMSTIEGGMICTDDDELAEMLKIVRANGWDRNLTSAEQFKWRKEFGIKSEFEAKYTFYDLGFNIRPTEITGFIGLYQLQFLDQNIAKRESNFKHLTKIAIKNPDFVIFDLSHLSLISNFAFPVVCKTAELKVKYLAQFSGAGIEVRPMIAGNMQRQPFYRKYSTELFNMPGTDFIHDCGFYCGNYPELTETDLETIGNCMLNY
jgi:CDP-4-dehydro-6-deoxyglucose reductase, E1